MNNVFSLQQISRTGNLESNLISQQYKLNLLADFMRIRYENPKLKQSEIANQLGYSSSTLQRYRNDINMLSPYIIQINNTNKRTKKAWKTNLDNNSYRDHDLKRPQMTSNDRVKPNKRNENTSNDGSVHENIESNDQYLDESLHNKNSWVELAMQIVSNDKTVRSDTTQVLKEFNQQSLTTQAKKGEQIVSMMPAVGKAFNLMGDDKVELSVENDSLKNQIGEYDEKWLQESKVKLLKEIDDKKGLF